jgi:hypothetical protein
VVSTVLEKGVKLFGFVGFILHTFFKSGFNRFGKRSKIIWFHFCTLFFKKWFHPSETFLGKPTFQL